MNSTIVNGIELSVIVPARSEEAVLRHSLDVIGDVLRGITAAFELIVVDDGSNDGTFAIVREAHAADGRIKGVRLSRGFGKEAALMAGMGVARGQAVITLDADLQHPPQLIPKMVEQWRNGAKIVHGVKEERLFGGTFHRFAAQFFNRFFSKIAGFDMVGSSDFKLLDAKIARLLVERFPEHSRFHRGLSTWMGYRQVSLPFNVEQRKAGVSRWRLMDLLRYAWNTLTAYSSFPLKLIPVMGLIMLVISVVLGLEAVMSRVSGDAVSGFATLEITILFTGSMIMIGLGIMGQYLSRMYDELKRRPLFLVDEVVGIETKSGSNAEPPP